VVERAGGPDIGGVEQDERPRPQRLTRHPRQASRAALGRGTGGVSRIGNGEGEAGDDP
jgi:hypothetical protein